MMSQGLVERLRNFTTIGKKVNFHEKSAKKRYYELGEVIGEVAVVPDNSLDYKHFIQKIRGREGEISYRYCYYTLDAGERRIVFGQFAPNMSEQAFVELMRKAIERFGVIPLDLLKTRI